MNGSCQCYKKFFYNELRQSSSLKKIMKKKQNYGKVIMEWENVSFKRATKLKQIDEHQLHQKGCKLFFLNLWNEMLSKVCYFKIYE